MPSELNSPQTHTQMYMLAVAYNHLLRLSHLVSWKSTNWKKGTSSKFRVLYYIAWPQKIKKITITYDYHILILLYSKKRNVDRQADSWKKYRKKTEKKSTESKVHIHIYNQSWVDYLPIVVRYWFQIKNKNIFCDCLPACHVTINQ